VFQAKKIAEVRKQQRIFVQKYFDIIVPFVIIICAAWVGILAMMNVRERRQEIGVMRALGYGSGKISLLFLGKAVVIGLLGAVLGFVLGTVLTMTFGPYIFKLTAGNIKPVYGLLGWFMVAAPLFSAVCSLVPTMTAVMQDPVVTLREE
jgi:putative ABC transport system permease protein